MISRFDAAEGAYVDADDGTPDLSTAQVVPVPVRGERSGAFRPFCVVPAHDAAVMGG